MRPSAPGFAKHPDYQVEIIPTADRVRILAGDNILADTTRPLRVTESRHHPVWYLPMEDVADSLLTKTSHSTYCPFKGEASYWSIHTATTALENAVWGYENPFVECEPLMEHVAFYTDRVALEVNGEIQSTQGPGWVDRTQS